MQTLYNGTIITKHKMIFTILFLITNYAVKLAKKLVTMVFSLASVSSESLPSLAITSNKALSEVL